MIETTVMHVQKVTGKVNRGNWLELTVQYVDHKGELMDYDIAFCFQKGVTPAIELPNIKWSNIK
tara:strand:+ start:146 stop:337 length:192 start_codon:yes stop_codon:yes gene_type:complete